jgi:hypothetical protein
VGGIIAERVRECKWNGEEGRAALERG